MSTASQLREARTALEEVRKLLLTPTPSSVEACAGPLQAAVANMVDVERELRAEGAVEANRLEAGDNVVPGVRIELEYLRRELKRVSALLEQASTIHRNWASVLGLFGSGYTAAGQPARPTQSSGRVALRG
jgi:hypothetical protein